MAVARNVLIILALAAIVEFAPGGGDGAALINAILFTLLNVVFVYFGVRFYRERRLDIYALGDRGRLLLYGGLAAIVLALAGARRGGGPPPGTLGGGLGDRGRLLLYGGLAAIVLALAGTRRWLDTAAGTIVWVLLIGGALAALVSVFRQYREYGG